MSTQEKFWQLVNFVVKNGAQTRDHPDQKAWVYGPWGVLCETDGISFIGGRLLHARAGADGWLTIKAGTRGDLDYCYEMLLRTTTSVIKSIPFLDRVRIFLKPSFRRRYRLGKLPSHLFR